MKIIVDNAIPFIKGVLEQYADIRYIAGADITPEVVQDCDAMIVRTRTICNESLLSASKVKLIATATIGTDHIDQEWCQRSGITVTNAAGCNARGVVQWVAAVLSHICAKDDKQPSDYTLGVVGVGNVGSLVTEYAQHWGFRVIKCDPPRQRREGGDYVSINELAKKCDIITLHTPLDSTTRHLVNRELIQTMKPNAIIINASRGGVADNRAVFESGHRYIFDVWEEEPNIPNDILSNAELATPHIAGYSKQGKANATAMVIRSLSDHFSLPHKEWYPSEVTPTRTVLIDWEDMISNIKDYCPISEQSNRLKNSPDSFESQRNNYNYREEFF